MIPQVLGGIGLFLLGMTLLTDGLKSLAGDALRRALMRFAGGPGRALLSGAALTALVQSSSATTLATIGFVSAGLLTLPQAIGVVMGANLGTTSTAWLVSSVGLQLNIGTVALPLLGVGSLARILARDRVAAAGTTLAGFGLVFVGIDTLQAGMAELATRIDPSSLPGATFGGRLLLVAFGIVMTVVMQSSSAAITTTLAGVETGTITLAQAAALVVGQNIGTTVTAAIAAVGASVSARRTALAHVLFNAITGTVALLLLPLFVALVTRTGEAVNITQPAVTLSLFHTAFNVAGVVLLLPAIGPFAALVTRVVPDRGSPLTRNLDPSVTHVAAVAVEAAQRTLRNVAAVALEAARAVALRQPPRKRDLVVVPQALDETLEFLRRLRTETESASVHEQHVDCLHAIDHLHAVIGTCRESAKPSAIGLAPEIDAMGVDLSVALGAAVEWLRSPTEHPPAAALQNASSFVAERHRMERARTLRQTAAGQIEPTMASARLELMQRLERLAYASWRAVLHLGPREVPER